VPTAAYSYLPVPDASRLHIVFAKNLQEHELYNAFQQVDFSEGTTHLTSHVQVAPGLQYVSKHREKPCAFVKVRCPLCIHCNRTHTAKYTTSTSALLAMVRLNGTFLCGQRLRVTLADPMAL